MKYASAKLAWKWRSFRCSRSSCPPQSPALSYYLWPSSFLKSTFSRSPLFCSVLFVSVPSYALCSLSVCPPAVLFKLSVCTQNGALPASVHFADLACKLQPTFVAGISTHFLWLFRFAENIYEFIANILQQFFNKLALLARGFNGVGWLKYLFILVFPTSFSDNGI